MILYDPKIHESLLVAWHFHLKEDPEEHANLFMEPLRHLTELLRWASYDVKMMITWDAQGLWGASWVEPIMTGAFFGLWIRKEMRGTPAAVAFANHCYTQALGHFPVLIGVTKQPRLHAIHLRMGYEYVGEIPHLFDDAPAKVYVLTKESRDGRRRKDIQIESEQSVRAPAGELRNGSGGTVQAANGSDLASNQHRGRQRANPDNQPKRRRGKKRVQQQPEVHAGGTRAKRALGKQLRPANHADPRDAVR